MAAAAALTVAPHVATHRLKQHFERRGERVEIAGRRRRLQTACMPAYATVCARGTTAGDLSAHLQHLPLVPEDQETSVRIDHEYRAQQHQHLPQSGVAAGGGGGGGAGGTERKCFMRLI